MAQRRPKAKSAKGSIAAEVKEKTPSQLKAEDLLKRMRERYIIMSDADDVNRTKAIADLRFLNIPGEQWDAAVKLQRGERPCYEFNKTRITAKRIINDMRANRPAGKVRATEDADVDTANVYEGLIRNIWNVSDADTVIDYAAEYQVGGGMGGWRVDTSYSSNSSFDQDILIMPIKNPFCLYCDPHAADPMKRDAEDWILTERLSAKAFKDKYGDKEKIDFEEEFDDEADWSDDETVRVCEYWWKEPDTKTLTLLSDGTTTDEVIDPKTLQPDKDGNPVTVVKSRQVACHKIMMAICSGSQVLEGPNEWAGTCFPFVMVYGEWIVIEGRTYWHGITRFAKDAQRSYNVSRTAITETIALAPQSKFWATPANANGHTDKWGEAHSKLFPFLLYNPDPTTGGQPPQRMAGPDVPIALMQESQIASEEIKAVTGIFDNSLGQQANESSGRAIVARQRQGEIATFNYSDNMGKGIRRTWEILIDLIPKIYDSTRIVRIIGVDGAEEYQKINAQELDPATGQTKPINDLSRGKYDVVVTIGPSFATQRQEASETFQQLAQAFPPIMQVAGDLVFKAMDVPLSEQFAERMKFLLPPALQQKGQDGKPLPPEAVQAMQQADQAMAQVNERIQMVQQAEQELTKLRDQAQSEQGQNDSTLSQIKLAAANLDTQRAQFETFVTKEIGALTQKQAQLEVQIATAKSDQAQANSEQAQQVQEQANSGLTEVASHLGQIAQGFVQALSQIQSTPPQVLIQHPPRVKAIVRQNGMMIPQYEDQATT
jgi:hypothetical protein